MKKLVLFVSILGLGILFSQNASATSAACTNKNTYGSVSLTLPLLPTRGTYTVWTRMQVPDATNTSYHLEINSNSCFQVGGKVIDPGVWTWVSYQDGDTNNEISYDFDQTSENKIVLIGSRKGVKLDRLLLVKNDCVPVNLGNNCQSDATPVAVSDVSGAAMVPPPSTGMVSGTIFPSNTIARDAALITKVVYYADGKPIPATDSFKLDTTLLGNGPHSITMQIQYADSSVINQVTNIEVANKQTAFSPVRRYIRLNTRTILTLSTVIGVILLLVLLLMIVRHTRLQKRLLVFRGF